MNRLPARRLALALLLAAGLSTAGAAPAGPAAMRAGMFEPPYPAPELGLRGTDGAELSLKRYRGKVVLLAFGYTRCSEVCPVTLATLAQAQKTLGSAADAMQVLYVTVDPARDDLASIKAYLGGYQAGFVGGTGQQAAIDRVLKSYGAVAEKADQRGGDYSMGHTAAVFLIDRQGRLRAMMPFGREAQDFVHDVRFLLAQ
jgi:protein SCO1/2